MQYSSYFYSHGSEWMTLFVDAPEETHSAASDRFTEVS